MIPGDKLFHCLITHTAKERFIILNLDLPLSSIHFVVFVLPSGAMEREPCLVAGNILGTFAENRFDRFDD